MIVGLLIFSGLPVPTGVPPQDPLYHFATAPVPRVPPDAVNVNVPPASAQKLSALELADAGAADNVFTVTVTLAHPDEEHGVDSQRA